MKTKIKPLILLLPVSMLALLFLAFTTQSGPDEDWTGIREELRPKIKNISILSHGGVGYAGTPTEWINRKEIMKTATISELKRLTYFSKPEIRATGYEGLILKKQITFQLISDVLTDTAKVSYMSGCLFYTMPVYEFVLSTVYPINSKGTKELDRYFTAEEQKTIKQEYNDLTQNK